MIALLRELLDRASGLDVRPTAAGDRQGARPADRRRRPACDRAEGAAGTPSPSATTRAAVITDRKGKPEPDPDLRDNENVPLPPVPVGVRGRPDRAARHARVPHRRRRLHARPRSSPTSPTPGSTTTRRRSATRSRSPATSTSTSRPARSRRSTPRSSELEDEIQELLARLPGEATRPLKRLAAVNLGVSAGRLELTGRRFTASVSAAPPT